MSQPNPLQPTNQQPSKPKKSLLKKWWFWVIVFLIVIVLYVVLIIVPNYEDFTDCMDYTDFAYQNMTCNKWEQNPGGGMSCVESNDLFFDQEDLDNSKRNCYIKLFTGIERERLMDRFDGDNSPYIIF